jgi:outer membrane protein
VSERVDRVQPRGAAGVVAEEDPDRAGGGYTTRTTHGPGIGRGVTLSALLLHEHERDDVMHVSVSYRHLPVIAMPPWLRVGRFFVFALLGIVGIVIGGGVARAQDAPITLQQAVTEATDRYPSVRAAEAQVSAASASQAIARDAYLPRADALWQINRSTRNNISGLLFPQGVLPAISGAVAAESADSIWNHAAGVLVAWEPLDFGYRSRMVRAADASRQAAGADEALTKLQVATAAADAYLTVLAADEAVRAAAAGVERARVVFEVVNARAQAGLRPGAEAARARAEVATAESAAARAEQGAAIARAELARWLGVAPERIVIAPGPFLRLPPETATGAAAPHPRVQAAAARVEAARATEAAAAKTYVPRLFVDAAAYARGSGAAGNGAIGGVNGLALTTSNWAVGFNVTFPLLDAPVLHQRQALEIARAQDASARYDQVVQDLSADLARAQAVLAAAQRLASLAPAQLDAARAAEEQARARYDSGLGNIADVADTQRLLTDAEISDSLARLAVWRAQLGVAAARGDLSPVLTMSATGGR